MKMNYHASSRFTKTTWVGHLATLLASFVTFWCIIWAVGILQSKGISIFFGNWLEKKCHKKWLNILFISSGFLLQAPLLPKWAAVNNIKQWLWVLIDKRGMVSENCWLCKFIMIFLGLCIQYYSSMRENCFFFTLYFGIVDITTNVLAKSKSNELDWLDKIIIICDVYPYIYIYMYFLS